LKTQLIKFAALLLSCAGIVNGPAQTIPGWSLVWSDEFTQADGSAPDPAKWGYDVGGNGWGNNELEYYTSSRTNNARIEGGQLVIEARQESFGGKNFTSARLLTKGKWAWTYGRIEARIKIPRGQGLWPAFWMLGANIDSVSWPTCGEIDIMENIGVETNKVHGTIHGPGYSGGNGIGGPMTLPGAAFADDFHVYAVVWETNRIRWYVDGQQFFSVTPASLPGATTWVFTQPQFLILNVAVGGNWPGNPDGTTVFPQRMTVDYVRVYTATNSAPATNSLGCAANTLVNPGFEVGGLANWTAYGNAIGNVSVVNSNTLPVHSGSNVLKLYGQFTGSANNSGVYQDVASAPGAAYTARTWALTPANDKIGAGNAAWLEVSFRDVGANILSLYRTVLITNTSPASAWLDLAVTNQIDPATATVIASVTNLVAPAGTAFVRAQALFQQPLNAAGAVLFDDLTLYYAGDPPVGVAAAALRSGNNLNISFATAPGLNYQVQFKNDLAEANWQVWTNVSGDGNAKNLADPLAGGRKFYRVMRVCN